MHACLVESEYLFVLLRNGPVACTNKHFDLIWFDLSLSLWLRLSASVCLSLSVCLSVCLSVSVSVSLSVCLSVCLSLSVSLSLSLSLSLCLSLSLSLSLHGSRFDQGRHRRRENCSKVRGGD